MWTKTLGAGIIESVSISIGGNELINVTGDGNPIIKHEGGTSETCHFCKKKNNMSIEDFQYFYGTYHKYNPDKKEWLAYQGKNGEPIYCISDEYANLVKELIKSKEVRDYLGIQK